MSNRPFDTTKGHILDHELNVIELTPMTNPTSFSESKTVFMGNIDDECITNFSTIDHCIVLVTMTDNGGGGQPMSMENYKKIAK